MVKLVVRERRDDVTIDQAECYERRPVDGMLSVCACTGRRDGVGAG